MRISLLELTEDDLHYIRKGLRLLRQNLENVNSALYKRKEVEDLQKKIGFEY